jgi:beta-glucanase (GH16 family)
LSLSRHALPTASLVALALLASAPARPHSTKPATPSLPGWTLTWSDEFNGPTGSGLDPAKWSIVTGGKGFGNNEMESYTERRENLRQENGNLVIEARKEHFEGADGTARDYTSGRIESRGKFDQAYGRFEARMKLPTGKGIWPAFWLLGNNIKSDGWPRSGEIDIMENIGDPKVVYGTLHGPGYSGSKGISSHAPLPEGLANTGFHTYAVEWTPASISFSVDGFVYTTRTPKDLPEGATWVYDHPFFILFNFAVGGMWPAYPDASTVFPQQMLVDYVRVYSR